MSDPTVVPGWNPGSGTPAMTDAQVFERLTAAVFQARFRPEIVQRRWPAIREALAGFDVENVASWPDEKVADLMDHPGMIRSPKKIKATLRNARDLLERSRRHGGARAYLDSFGGDEEALVRELDEWAHYIGAPSIRWFVRSLDG